MAATVAHAEVVVVVSAHSPVVSLAAEQAAQIFMGKTGTFPDGSQAVPIDQMENSSLRNEFYAKAAGRDATQLKVYWSRLIFTGKGRPPKEVSGNEAVKKLLESNTAAIGYIDRNAVDGGVKIVLVP